MSLLALSGTNSVSGGYEIDNSVKLEADNTEYFSRTPSSNTNRQTFTYSTWVKRTELGQNARLIDAHQDGQNFFTFGFDTSDRLVLYNIDSGVDYGGHYTKKFRDTSAWYHIVFKSDTTNGTAANRWQIYVNGVEVTDKDTDYGTPPQNYNSNLNSTISTKVGYNTDGSNGSSQYMAETHLVDGTALAPTAFGEVDDDTGIWKPIEVDVTYGTNGFYLNYITASNMGNDKSGENNDFAENNIAAADQATDTPTNNFATMNPLVPTADVTVSEGGTKVAASGGVSSWDTSFSSVGVTSGKWYFECRGTATDGTHFYGCVDESDIALVIDDFIGSSAGGPNAIGYYGNTGNIQINGSTVVSASSWPHNTTMALALDLDNGKAYFGRHNVWQNSANPANGTNGISLPTGGTGTWFFAINASYFDGGSMNTNHGGYTAQTPDSAASDENGYGTFEFAPPSGYYALCTKNLAEYG